METTSKRKSTNPIVSSIYTADPAPMVYGDTLYLYTTHDEDELVNDFYTMNDWRCFSTKNMVDWEDHGKIFSLDDIEWADARAWAPQCIARNGKFYLYCPVKKKDSGMAIAVGVSDSPTGPFKDLGYPLVDEGDWNDIDPTVFIDDDGQAYLYFGNPELRYVLLNEDMVSYDESVGVVKIPMTQESFAKGSPMTGTSYGEGPWFYKRDGLYYMVYAAFAEGKNRNEHLAYSTSKSPTGPWVYGGVLMAEEEGGIFTNHPGICDFKGHSYLFYHTGDLPGGSLFHRSVCVAEFTYNKDGSISTVPMCDGVEEVTDDTSFLERFEFRTIHSDEIEKAIAIEHTCFPPYEACSPENMTARIGVACDFFLVAVDKTSGKIAGFLNGIATDETEFKDEFFTDASNHNPDGDNVMICGLDVLPEYQMKGLARELVRQYAAREKSRGRKSLVLTCLDNKVGMYQKFGFVDKGISGSVWAGEEWHEMSLAL